VSRLAPNKHYSNFKDLTGQRFGKLLVLQCDKRNGREQYWFCRCDCGRDAIVLGRSLKNGDSKSCGCYLKRTGESSHRWKGGITKLTQAIRSCLRYRQWRSDVLHIANYICQDCLRRRAELHAHHIKSFQDIINEYNITTVEQAIACEELWNINNGVCLCIDCHRSRHNKHK
jgi:hypothetical protein